MKGWRMAALLAALLSAAGISAAMAPVAFGQTKVVTAQSPRSVEVFTRGSRIGVSIRDLEEADAKTAKGVASGVVIEGVSSDSPAEKAGMRKADVIVEFDGERVRSVRQLTRLVQETPAGRSVPGTVVRDGQRMNVTVTPNDGNSVNFDGMRFDNRPDVRLRVAPRPPTPPMPPTPPAFRFDDLLGRTSRLGMTVDALSSQLADYFGTKRGVLVTSVYDNSAAAKAGLKAGDVLTSFNGSAIEEPSDVRRRIQSLQDGDEFTIDVMRDRKPVTLKGKAERTDRRPSFRTII